MVKKKEVIYRTKEIEVLTKKSLYWANTFQYVSYLNPNDISFPYEPFIHVLAVGRSTIQIDNSQVFKSIKESIDESNDWLFGYFGYDLKNQIEDLNSNNQDRIGLVDSNFFIPEHLVFFEETSLRIVSNSPSKVIEEILQVRLEDIQITLPIKMIPSMSRSEYLKKVTNIRNHIEEGDVYELNLCMEFFAENQAIDPVHYYLELCKQSPMPFSGFQKWQNTFLICASPERFLKKKDQEIISQPIKGTIRRGISRVEDELLKESLRNDEKEIAENMMIVDLVRNDLAKTAMTGSIKVKEIFGIYTFEQVHQMISTVVSTKNPEIHIIDVIKNAFPMGSMTGAPKIRSMQLIEKYENTKRGLYSGSIGYFDPKGDFDFNVVIRSLIYNLESKTLSFQVGSAITYDSIPENEYEECLLKAKAIQLVLKGNNTH